MLKLFAGGLSAGEDAPELSAEQDGRQHGKDAGCRELPGHSQPKKAGKRGRKAAQAHEEEGAQGGEDFDDEADDGGNEPHDGYRHG